MVKTRKNTARKSTGGASGRIRLIPVSDRVLRSRSVSPLPRSSTSGVTLTIPMEVDGKEMVEEEEEMAEEEEEMVKEEEEKVADDQSPGDDVCFILLELLVKRSQGFPVVCNVFRWR